MLLTVLGSVSARAQVPAPPPEPLPNDPYQPVGRWVVIYDRQGAYEYDLNPDPLNQYPRVILWNDPVSPGNLLTYSSGNGFSARVRGSIVAILRWLDQNGNPAPNPPRRVYLLEEGIASWWVGWGPLGAEQPDVGGTADNGLGDPAVYGVDSSSQYMHMTSAGKHLVQRDGSSGEIHLWFIPTAQFTGLSTTQYGHAQVGANFMVTVDTRGITLRRDSAVGETIDQEGTVYGDTIYSRDVTILPADPGAMPVTYEEENIQQFHPEYVGSWHWVLGETWEGWASDVPDVEWRWEPSHSGNKWDLGIWKAPKGTIALYNGATGDYTYAPSGISTMLIMYSAKDRQDGAQCEAWYVIRVHDPIELKTHHTYETVFRNIRDVPNSAVVISYPGEIVNLSEGKNLGYSWSVQVNPLDSLTKLLGGWLGVSFQLSSGSTTVTRGFTSPPNLPANTVVKLAVADLYRRHWGEVTLWNAAGKVGERSYKFYEPQSLENPTGVFVIWLPPDAPGWFGIPTPND